MCFNLPLLGSPYFMVNKFFFLYDLGPPAEVEVDIMVRSMGPISEIDMVSFLLFTEAFVEVFLPRKVD